jgi:hypothetical protein
VPGVAYQLLVATAIVDASLLWTFFRGRARAARSAEGHPPGPLDDESLELAA